MISYAKYFNTTEEEKKFVEIVENLKKENKND